MGGVCKVIFVSNPTVVLCCVGFGVLTTFEINWKTLQHAKPFSPVNGQCALCTTEKKFIIFKPELGSLNSRNELGAHCRHKKSRLLYKKPRAKEKT